MNGENHAVISVWGWFFLCIFMW